MANTKASLIPQLEAGHIARQWAYARFTLGTDVGDVQGFDMRPYAGALLYVPAGVGTVTWYTAVIDQNGNLGTPEKIADAGTDGVTTVAAADRWIKVPDACFAAGALFMVADLVAENAIIQAKG